MPGIQDAIAAIISAAQQAPQDDSGRMTKELKPGRMTKELKSKDTNFDENSSPSVIQDIPARGEDQPELNTDTAEDGGKIMKQRESRKGDGRANKGEEPKPSDAEEAEETAINTENFMKAISAILGLIGGGAGTAGTAVGRSIGSQIANQGQEAMPGYASNGITQGMQQAPMMAQMPTQQDNQMLMPQMRGVPAQREGVATPLRDVPIMRNRAEER